MDGKAIALGEQQRLTCQDQAYVDSLGLSFSSDEAGGIPPYLGLSPDGWSSHYVGAAWLGSGPRPLVVHPKVERIDYASIFASALADGVAPAYFREAYSINLDAPLIEDDTLNAVLTPLLVAHFLCVMRPLLAKGLKRSYIVREDNLLGKVRGRMLPWHHLRQNLLRGRADRSLCRFQEYAYDYPENRLLKRALLAAERLMLSLRAADNALLQTVRRYLMAFSEISADITPSAVKALRRDKLHGDYPEALRLAVRILRRTDYAVDGHSAQPHLVPEFAVDMSRIFEFHVLGLLRRHFADGDILFQEPAGLMGRPDYLIPSARLIVDAKYKTDYPLRDSNTLRADVREVGGYSRSERVRTLLQVDDAEEVACLIIYPAGADAARLIAPDEGLLDAAQPLRGVHHFYTLGIPVPTLP